MSAPGDQKSPTDKPEGLNKYVQRVRTVLRRSRTSKSITGIKDLLADSGKGESSKPKAETKDDAVVAPETKTEPVDEAPATTSTSAIAPAKVDRNEEIWKAQQDRMKALFAKYGLTLEDHELPQLPTHRIERIEKPIRMRVHRQCHRCEATFGADKICNKCEHVRCKKCPRYPVRRTKEEKEAKAARAAAAAAAGPAKEPIKRKREENLITIPSRTGGQDLVRKPIRQRVRRTCHKCDALFVKDATECTGCSHVRCKKCPRDPPKLKKYPDGYPGDAEPEPEIPQRVFRKARMRVRWTCHDCEGLFIGSDKTCPSCKHERCLDCTRDPPKKQPKTFDPELVKRVEEKLAALTLSFKEKEGAVAGPSGTTT